MRRLFFAVFVLSMIGTIFVLRAQQPGSKPIADLRLPSYSLEQLKAYDGTDPKKPILLAMDGLIYDVTKGKEYYQPGAPYHYLAGRDSSVPLHLVGASIIKRKYKVIGVLKT